MSAAAQSGGQAGASNDESLLSRSARCRAALKACLQGRRRLSLVIMLALVILAAAAAVALVAASPLLRAAPHEVILELGRAPVFYSAPPFTADLKRGAARVHVVRLALSVEVPEVEMWRLDAHQIEIEDAVRARLRDFDRRELDGSAGTDRLRSEILAIINDAIAPAAASRVLFQQFVVD